MVTKPLTQAQLKKLLRVHTRLCDTLEALSKADKAIPEASQLGSAHTYIMDAVRKIESVMADNDAAIRAERDRAAELEARKSWPQSKVRLLETIIGPSWVNAPNYFLEERIEEHLKTNGA